MLEHGNLGTALVLHDCDNPPCVRQSHLFLGTQADNIADMDTKGRSATGYRRPNAPGEKHWSRRHDPVRGERHGCAKLTAGDVHEIRRRIAAGDSHSAIAADYPISKSMVSRIRTGRAWGHV